MTSTLRRLTLALLLASPLAARGDAPPEERGCVQCHERLHPGIVSDWRISKHGKRLVSCDACHGALHRSTDDVAEAVLPTPATCERCHPQQVAQFMRGKHARAWSAAKAFPTFHNLPASGVADPADCAVCHRIGVKTPEETAELVRIGARHRQASCDACHTRHLFSKNEARHPEACRTCHGTLQFDPWRNSKHGLRSQLKSEGQLPPEVAAPGCQTCHMQGGDHGVRAPWGSLALRVPEQPLDDWGRDRTTLLVALGVLAENGGHGPRYDAAEDTGLVVLDRIQYQNDRLKLTSACRQCHAAPFVREQLDQRDALVRQADRLCAKAVQEVAALYADGFLPKKGSGPWPDLVRAVTGSPVERRLATMMFEHRTRMIASAFHMSSDAALWRGALGQDLMDIEALADQLRAARPAAPAAKPARGPGK